MERDFRARPPRTALALVVASGLVFGACSEGQSGVSCADGKDNDGDGLIDCADADCETYCQDDDGDCAAGDCDGDGWSVDEGDCDDEDQHVHPEADEACDGADQDCDQLVDEDFDLDHDGYPDAGIEACAEALAPELLDCDDGDPLTHPGADEVCQDGVDNDCDGMVDEDLDEDGDGHTNCDGDCDDDDPAVYPGAPEACNDTDDDCDGEVDEGLPTELYYPDDDGDGHGEIDGAPVSDCDQPEGYALSNDDCDDDDSAVYPGAEEILCDGKNNDCDLATRDNPDGDGDGFGLCDDCDDADPAIHPDAVEVDCDGQDNDCDPTTPDGPDGDGDGYTTCEGAGGDDCNDADAAVNPGQAEVTCDQLDNDCDPSTLDAPDGDGDGYVICLECDDTDPLVNPGMPEITCDGIDNDCDPGTVDNPDADGDGYAACDDCDDGDPAVNPDGIEVECDGADNDCDGQGDQMVPSDHATIGDAIAAAADGDMVCVAPGTYEENIDFGGKAIHVLGLAGPDATVIDGTGGRVVTFANGEGPDSVLEGTTVTGGNTGDRGGGLYIDGTSPTLIDLVITGNYANVCGGGVYVDDGGSPTFTDVRITSNSTASGTWGGAGIYVYDASVTLTRAEISGNLSRGNEGGAALSIDLSSASLTDVVISGNTAYSVGGAIRADNSSLSIRNGRITGNLSQHNRAGGLYLDWSQATLRNVIVAGNRSEGYNPEGGGLYVWKGTVNLDHVAVVNNTALSEGGGLYLYDCTANLDHTIIAGNQAGSDGGGIRSVVATTTVTYGDLWDNTPEDVFGMADPTGADGNVAVDPLFLDLTDPDPLAWDVHLDASSPLVDAGDPAEADPDGSLPDMGPYGGSWADSFDLDWDGYFEWWLPGPYDPVTSPGMDCDDLDDGVYPGAGC